MDEYLKAACDNCAGCPNQAACAEESDLIVIDAIRRASDDLDGYIELDENGVPLDYEG